MPVSRKRNRRPRRPDRRRARRHGGRRIVASVRPGQDLEPFLTQDDIAAMHAAMEAARHGDAETALRREMEGLVVEGTTIIPKLRELVGLGKAASGWPFARWCVDQASRWMLLEHDPRTDDAVRHVMAYLHLEQLEALLEDPVALKEYGTLVMACDWACHQLLAYELGGLADFLDVRAEAGLLDRADLVRQWPAAPMGVYADRGFRGASLVLEDLATGEEIEVLNIGAMAERDSGAIVLGRVVPIIGEPGRMFESRPLEIDEETAADVVRFMTGDEAAPDGWLDALALARLGGRLRVGFSWEERTLYLSDLLLPDGGSAEVGAEDGPRVRDLIRRGHAPDVANAIGVLEVCLISVQVDPELAGRAAPHVLAAFAVAGTYEAALQECTSSAWQRQWADLAASVTGEARGWCEELAARCRDAA